MKYCTYYFFQTLNLNTASPWIQFRSKPIEAAIRGVFDIQNTRLQITLTISINDGLNLWAIVEDMNSVYELRRLTSALYTQAYVRPYSSTFKYIYLGRSYKCSLHFRVNKVDLLVVRKLTTSVYFVSPSADWPEIIRIRAHAQMLAMVSFSITQKTIGIGIRWKELLSLFSDIFRSPNYGVFTIQWDVVSCSVCLAILSLFVITARSKVKTASLVIPELGSSSTIDI